MAGVSNQPNLKPLIDNQTEIQELEFTRVKNNLWNNGLKLDQLIDSGSTFSVNLGITHSEVRNSRAAILAEFDSIRALLSSEIDSNGDLTVANLTSFKTAIIDEVQNSQSALNFTVSTSGDAILDAIGEFNAVNLNRINGARDALYGYARNYRTETKEQIEALDLSLDGYITAAKTDTLSGVSGYVTAAKTAVIDSVDAAKTATLSGVSSYVTTAKTAVIDSVNAAKTAVLNGVSGYVTAAKTAVLDEINSARVNILTTVSGYITTAKNAVISAVNASENRITANVNAKASGIKSVQRGVVTMDMALMTNVSISSVNLAKSTLIINERGSVGGFLSAANQIRFEKSPTASNYQDGDTAIIYWQVIEYV